jgi:hypothetical protein
MTTYFGLWKENTTIPPTDPALELQRFQMFQAMLKQQIQSGTLKEVHNFLGVDGGYFITGDITPKTLQETLLVYSPYVNFEVHETLPTLDVIESVIAVQRARASAIKVPT